LPPLAGKRAGASVTEEGADGTNSADVAAGVVNRHRGCESGGQPIGFLHAPQRPSNWAQERAANDFAAEILMPREMVIQTFTKSPSAATLADRFNVSELAMGYRLVNLGLR
jgi:hypothetical protein